MTMFSRRGKTSAESSRAPVMSMLALAVVSTAIVAAPAWAADDLPFAGDIQMPSVDMPSVDVDVRIGDDLDRPHSPPRVYPRGPFAAMPPARYVRDLPDRPTVPPHQVAAMLQSTGYSLLGPVNRRGWVYTVAVLNPRGDDGRAVIDARTGAIIRFIPALDVDARFNDELTVVYGPPGPPPVTDAGYETRRGSLLDLRRSPRPPVAVPHAAQQTPPKTASRAASSAQPSVATPSAAKPAVAKPAVAKSSVAKPAVAAAPLASKTAENKAETKSTGTVGAASTSASQPPAPDLKLWPTQAMPDVQPLE